MKAAYVRRYGGNEVIEVGDLPRPATGSNDLLVQVKAASVNPVDFKIRHGQTRLVLPYKFPLILGFDCAGVVVETGSSVTRFRPGDEVFGRLETRRCGAFAEYAAMNESVAAMKPRRASFIEAASIPLVGLTCWQALLDVAALKSGQKVLIHAGSGGVGTFAIQLAKHVGATVATTVSARNLALARSLGADVTIDYHHQKFEDVVRDYDVVLDTLGGGIRARSFGVLKKNGILVTIYGIPTAKVGRAWDFNPLVRAVMWLVHVRSFARARRCGVRYEYVLMHPDGRQLGDIGALLENGEIKPVIDRVFPLAQVRDAFAHSESGRAVGKIIVTP